jgi:GNAT superfamily N-acetyltransferase
MATESPYTIAPLSPETWSAFDALVQRHNGIFGGCWCIWFHPDGPERGQGAEANRALKKAYVEQGKAHAALVMDGDEAIAWAEYGTPVELPTLHHRKEYDATKTADPDYRITCVFVDKRHRRRGVTELAITGALDLIAQAGGGRVESYPHDLTNQTKKMSSSFLYNGTRRLYERLGFTYDRPKGLKNCVMVKTVDPALGRSIPAVANLEAPLERGRDACDVRQDLGLTATRFYGWASSTLWATRGRAFMHNALRATHPKCNNVAVILRINRRSNKIERISACPVTSSRQVAEIW